MERASLTSYVMSQMSQMSGDGEYNFYLSCKSDKEVRYY